MYNDYFGFREKPFSVTPDPRFFYTNPHYQEAYANLVYAIYERQGFVVLTGEIGTGKTTLLRRLMENLDANIRVVFFYNTTLNFEELLDFICEDLGLEVRANGRLQKIQALNRFLIEQLAKGGTAVLLIDEAQNLGEEVLENLRLLSNLETSKEKLLQIALVGQPELEVKLDLAALRQLKQRIALQCRLSRLAAEEVGAFINHRLQTAGYKGRQLFAPDAVQEIALYSKGFPRLINILCDNALLIAYATSKKRVTADIIRETATDLRFALPGDEARMSRQANGSQIDPESRRMRRHSRAEGDPTRRRSHRRLPIGLSIGISVLAFVLAGASMYAWGHNSSVVESLREGLGALHSTMQNAIHRLTSEAERDVIASHVLPETSVGGFSESPVERQGTPSALTPPASDHRTGDSHTSGEAPIPKQSNDILGKVQYPGTPNSATALFEGSAWKQEPMAIPAGSTVIEIAARTYDANRVLGLDLIKEFNTHIDDLNRVAAGQKLWLPPLTRETLVRQQLDGTYHVILGSFWRSPQAEQVAHSAHLKGYSPIIAPRNLGANLNVYRVEIKGLADLAAVDDVWETAVTDRWITLASK